MASKLKGTIPPNQPGITTYINKTSSPATKRQLNSPEAETPPIKKINMSDNMSENLPPDLKLLYDSISQKLDERLDPLESQVNILFDGESSLPKHVEDVAHVKYKQSIMEARLNMVERENVELKQKLTKIEDMILENSVIVSGLSENNWEEAESRCELLNTELAKILPGETPEVKLSNAKALQIEKTERIGRYNPTKGRPVAIKFAYKKDADWLIASRKKLTKGIYVQRQYCEKTEYERRRLRPILSAARKLEEYKGKCQMEGTDLIIKGKCYNWSNLQDLPENISTASVSSRQDATHYGYFSELNPLSNFFPASFKFEGVQYHSSEQYIQCCKAKFCGDTETCNSIMQASTSVKCKQLGKKVKNCDVDKWNKSAAEICYPGILSKFQQNSGIATFLRNTGSKTIVECCYDDVWGNGYPLSNDKCIDPNVYASQGIMGTILEKIREVLNESSETVSMNGE